VGDIGISIRWRLGCEGLLENVDPRLLDGRWVEVELELGREDIKLGKDSGREKRSSGFVGSSVASKRIF